MAFLDILGVIIAVIGLIVAALAFLLVIIFCIALTAHEKRENGGAANG